MSGFLLKTRNLGTNSCWTLRWWLTANMTPSGTQRKSLSSCHYRQFKRRLSFCVICIMTKSITEIWSVHPLNDSSISPIFKKWQIRKEKKKKRTQPCRKISSLMWNEASLGFHASASHHYILKETSGRHYESSHSMWVAFKRMFYTICHPQLSISLNKAQQYIH